MNAKEKKLKPCPFCGSKDAPCILPNGIGDFYVHCLEDAEGCGVTTSDVSCETEEKAAYRWNRRAIRGKK